MVAVWGCRAEKPRATQPKKMAASKHQEVMTKTQMSREPRSFTQSRWYKLTFKGGWVWSVMSAPGVGSIRGHTQFRRGSLLPLLFSLAYQTKLILSGRAFSIQSCELNGSFPQTHLEVGCARFAGVSQSSHGGSTIKPRGSRVKLLTYTTIR